jgi:hypothetical protein
MQWRKSSYSDAQSQCVEVAADGHTVAVRDSKRPDAGNLSLGRAAWLGLLGDVKTGRVSARARP